MIHGDDNIVADDDDADCDADYDDNGNDHYDTQTEHLCFFQIPEL